MFNRAYKYYEDARTLYYERLMCPASFKNFTDIINHTQNSATTFKSLLPIKFKTLEFGDTQEIIIKKLGRPRFVHHNNEFSPTVFFYKELLLSHKLLMQLHFFDKKFVLATQSVIDTDIKWRQGVKTIILEKYSGDEKLINPVKKHISDIDKNLIFADEDNNKIVLMESINLNIIYASGDPTHLNAIESFTTMKIKKRSDEENNLKAILKNSF